MTLAVAIPPDQLAIFVAGPTLASMAGIWLQARYARKAADAADKAQLGILKAQEDAATAQVQASQAAERLVDVAKTATIHREEERESLDRIEEATQVAKVTGEKNHGLLNSQRTALLTLNAALARRIANENPDDPVAQEAARHAEVEADQATQAAAAADPVDPASTVGKP